MPVKYNLSELVGNTPIKLLSRYIQKENLSANILAKLEYFNPIGSIKDRVAIAMIENAQKMELINENSSIIEPTSGNTGIALAAFGAAYGYKVIIAMPESMSVQRRKLLKSFGAEIILTPAAEGMRGATKKAKEISLNIPNSYIPNQFDNPINPYIHETTTAIEILKDTEKKVDILVAGVGIGGSRIVIRRCFKNLNKDIQIIAVEPTESPFLSKGISGSHNIQGIGAGFAPKNLDKGIIDRIFTVDFSQASNTVKELAITEGILVGISSGASLFAAKEIAKEHHNKHKNIVVIFPDGGDRYL